MVRGWLVASVAWAVLVGALGVTMKLALRHTTWPLLVVGTTGAYILMTIALVAVTPVRIPSPGPWLWWVVASAFISAGSLFLLSYALTDGKASQVVPITAIYPLVTVLLSALFLSETLTLKRIVGAALIVLGASLVL